ncbi:FecR domain-containing protein [Dongia sp.]|uniref:FecR family protein n=1 Tax=Dongia sp. TaxID=1977262 RepID=UPI0035B02AF0
MRSIVQVGVALLSLPVLAGAFAASAAADDPIGLVQRVQNAVYGTEPQGNRTPKFRRDGIVFNELIETTQNSAIEIGFVDGSELTIGAQAKVQIDHFTFDQESGDGEATLNLGSGAFRWITGLMPPDGMDIETPTATISIRGTNVKIGVRANGNTEIGLDDGAVHILAKGNGAVADIKEGQSARVTPDGIEIIDRVISVADGVVDDGWFNSRDQDRGKDNSTGGHDSQGGGQN